MRDLADFSGRAELFRAVADWWQRDDRRYFLLGGGVGTGKTTAMARLAAGEVPVTASHFCDPRTVSTRDPAVAARTLARQLAAQIEGFTEAYAAMDRPGTISITGEASAGVVQPGAVNTGVSVSALVIEGISGETHWHRAVTGPLGLLAADGRLPPVLIAVDALDESELYDGPTKLTDLVLAVGDTLPQVRWLVSTRYPDLAAVRLADRDVRRWGLSEGPGGAETHRDVRTFLARELGLGDGPALRQAEQRTGGNFLHARLLVETVRACGTPDPELVLDVMARTPPDLDGSQHGYLRQIVGSDPEAGWLNGYHPVFSALVAAREPVDLPTLARLSGLVASVAARVIERIGPLLSPEAVPSGEQRYSLYHAQFREFLTDRNRAAGWWCDPDEAEQRVMRAYEARTRQWSRWQGLDAYGIRHLMAHARRAGWTAADFDQLVVPGYAAGLAEEKDALASVLRALDLPVAVATAEPDLARTFFWSWTARRVRGALLELLGSDVPTLLVKAGHEELAVASLNLTEGIAFRAGRLSDVVNALAAEGRWAKARTVVSLAAPEERPPLLLVMAAVRARSDPEQAWTLVEEALGTDGEEHRARLLDGYGRNLLTTLAATPALADRALELAGDREKLLDAVVAGLTRWAPGRAVDVAPEQYLPARKAAFEALAAQAPADDSLVEEWADRYGPRIRYRQALEGRLSRRWIRRATADPDELTGADLLCLAAALTRAPENAELRDALGRTRPVLPDAAALSEERASRFNLRPDVLAGLDLAPLRQDPVAAAIGAATVFGGLQTLWIVREFSGWGRDGAAEAGHLCAALAVLDPASADEIVAAMEPEEHLDRLTFYETLVSRLCPTDPEHAWRIAGKIHYHTVLRAWADALPASSLATGMSKVASIDTQFSGTRAELAGQLAAKLPPGDRERARELLRLTSPIAESAPHRLEYDAIAAAFTTSTTAQAEPLVVPLLERIKFLPPHEARTDTPEADAGSGLLGAADHVAARARKPGIALLAATAAELLRSGEADRQQASVLLRACLDPGFDLMSVHIPKWPGLARSVRQAYACWHDRLGRPLDAYVELLLTRLSAREAFMAMALLFAELPPPECERLVGLAERHSPGTGAALEPVLLAQKARLPSSAWAGLIAEAAQHPRTPYPTLLTLARTRPQTALDVVRGMTEDRILGDLGLDSRDVLLVHLAPALARADRTLALAVAHDIRGREPNGAVGRDALHAIALAVAEEDWPDGLRIARSIDLPNVRGPALGTLAQAATRLSSARARGRAYLAVMEAMEAEPLEYSFDSFVRKGLLAALAFDPEPHPGVLARLIPLVMDDHDPSDGRRQLTALARLVARDDPGATALAPEALRSAESFLTAAWRW